MIPEEIREANQPEVQVLLFDKPIFHIGLNLTVRKGSKWADKLKAGDKVLLSSEKYGFEREAVVHDVEWESEFSNLNAPGLGPGDLVFEHDPACRTYDGLLNGMQDAYGDFYPSDDVTLIWLVV